MPKMKLLELSLVVFLQIYKEAFSKDTPSVIIVGAGPAGIAAATRLLEHDYKHILVLEAENRVGGRINSIFLGDAYIDLGAEWCHGSKDNIVYEMVKNLNVLKHEELNRIVYHSSKRNIDKAFGTELMDIMDSIYVPDGHRNEEEGKTVGQYCIDKYNATIHDKYKKSPDKLELAKSSIDLFHHYVLSSEGSFSWFETSARNDYKDCIGDLNLNWNGFGYKTVLEVLMGKFPNASKQPIDQTVLLNKEVITVLWNASSNSNATVVVQCSDQTLFQSDHIIFTPSIGVLKEQHQQMFVPRLPKEKQEAIRQIGFGAVMKVALYFKNRWWVGTNFTELYFIWSEDDKNAVAKEFPEGPLKEGRSWLTELFNINSVPKNPNVLVAWLTGSMIPQIESMSNETMIRGIAFVLNKFMGDKYNITEPDGLIRTFWYTNPHFRGSYSYQTVEARKQKVTAEMELAKPLLNKKGQPTVQFAGEASHPYYYSTVHGAIETGYREADRIINLYK